MKCIHSQVLLVCGWYALNTFYNIYNKKAANMMHAHWFLAAAQLVVGIGTYLDVCLFVYNIGRCGGMSRDESCDGMCIVAAIQ